MARTLFGLNPKEVTDEIIRINTEYQIKVTALQVEIVKSKEKLKEADTRVVELQRQLNKQKEREHQTSDVMVTAQINAQRIEDQARAKAESLIQEADEELHRKYQELELLKIKIKRVKEDIVVTLDCYKSSLDCIDEKSDDAVFIPNLVKRQEYQAKSFHAIAK